MWIVGPRRRAERRREEERRLEAWAVVAVALRRAALEADAELQGVLNRGPWQSVPVFVERLALVDAASRQAWAAWASHTLGQDPLSYVVV